MIELKSISDKIKLSIIFTSVSGTNFKIKSINAKSFSDIKITIPGRGLGSISQNKGAYIFKIHTKIPSLDELINIENFIFTSVSGTNFKIKSIKAKSFNDIRITIPGRGMSTGAQNKGSYIFKIHTKVPNFDKLTDSEKLDLISLINKTK